MINLHHVMVSKRPTIPLEDFQQLRCGYPQEDGEVCRLVLRNRWYLVKGYKVDGRLYLQWRRPTIQVRAELRHG